MADDPTPLCCTDCGRVRGRGHRPDCPQVAPDQRAFMRLCGLPVKDPGGLKRWLQRMTR